MNGTNVRLAYSARTVHIMSNAAHKEDDMLCYEAQLAWQVFFRSAFLTDRQMNPPLFDQTDEDFDEDDLSSQRITLH